jgi:putative ABC transport system substrate-binding protein
MIRRSFLVALGSTVAWPLTAHSQQQNKVWRVGLLETAPAVVNAANFEALQNGLRELGYIEQKNLQIEYRSADGRADRFPDMASELVRLKVDLIVTRGTPAVLAAKNATQTIPIVMAAIGEPVGTGAVGAIARPGGNVTGLSAFVSELEPKRIELMRELNPQIKRVALLYNMINPVFAERWEKTKAAARLLGIDAQILDVRQASDLTSAFNKASSERVEALVVGNDTVIVANRRQVVELAAKHQLPAIYSSREFVDDGGLMTYSVYFPDLYRRAATFVDKIFKGTRPADLPVEQPTKLELVINLKAAKAIGISIPPTVLARADVVVE